MALFALIHYGATILELLKAQMLQKYTKRYIFKTIFLAFGDCVMSFEKLFNQKHEDKKMLREGQTEKDRKRERER